jgi:hypothetical protein
MLVREQVSFLQETIDALTMSYAYIEDADIHGGRFPVV